jgi:hypothetical protein
MTVHDEAPLGPPPSAEIAAAEREIAETRHNLHAALEALRRELALPIAAVRASTALLDEVCQPAQLLDFVRRNALPLGLIGMGAAWLAVENRETLGTLGSAYTREFLERARALGKSAAAAALSAALDEIGRPAAEPRQFGTPRAETPMAPTPVAAVARAPGDTDPDHT